VAHMSRVRGPISDIWVSCAKMVELIKIQDAIWGQNLVLDGGPDSSLPHRKRVLLRGTSVGPL